MSTNSKEIELKRFEDISTTEKSFGGKALGLAQLLKERARVPAGFALQASTSPPEDWPEQLRLQFREECEQLLNSGLIAVRSSALAEDGAEHSYAGLFESYLELETVEEAFNAVKQCIRSGSAERVLSYAKSSEALPVGVVVQSMVNAKTAGVCFTIDPNGRDHAVLIEAVEGLGEALLSGLVTPESWRVYHNGFNKYEAYCEAPFEGKPNPLLQPELAALIAQEATALADQWGYPLDLEWAFDPAGTLHWLQARPITTMLEIDDWVIERAFDGVDDGAVTIWSNFNVRETMNDPLTPLSWSLFRDEMAAGLTDNMFGVPPSSPVFPHLNCLDRVHGRIYFNVNALLAAPLMGPLLRRFLSKVDAEAGAAINMLSEQEVISKRKLPGSAVTRWAQLLTAQTRMGWRIRKMFHPIALRRRIAASGKRVTLRDNVADMTDSALIKELKLISHPDSQPILAGAQVLSAAMGIWMIGEWLLKPWPEARQRLVTGIEGNPTTEISVGIDQLTEAARPLSERFLQIESVEALLADLETDEPGRAWLAQLSNFLALNGQRCPREFELAVARWSEQPGMIIDLIRLALFTPPAETVAKRLERLKQERQQAINAAITKASILRRPFIRLFTHLVELYMPLRELPKHHLMHVFMRIRQTALELGKRLTERKQLSHPEDIFLLEWQEIGALLADKKPNLDLDARREQLERFGEQRPPDFVRSDGVPVAGLVKPAGFDDTGTLHGVAISSSYASGPVRVLREPDPRLMSEGDVVVVEYADPGWTPLFPRASAVVMEVGGVMCHAAVVARELAIPAVFGVKNATSLLKDGQYVTVDGAAGTVKLEEGSA